LLIVCLRFKPDIIFSPTSPYTGHIARILHIKHICWGDTETATINLKSSLPFIDSLLLPDCFYEKVDSKKVVYFKSYKEIAYLHPNHFKSDPSILQKLGINAAEKIILMRFSALHAIHDIGLASEVEKNSVLILNYISRLSLYARVFISCTEKEPGKEFDIYKLDIHPADYISLLSFCSLYIGEGTTTASEAGVLGVPWIAIRPLRLGYLEDQEKIYDLGFRTDNIKLAFETALNWIQHDNMKIEWAIKRRKLLNEKIDFTSFLVWFIENYPESHTVMKNDPDYQDRFI
jgi:predicted glycosyltransferase